MQHNAPTPHNLTPNTKPKHVLLISYDRKRLIVIKLTSCTANDSDKCNWF